MLKSLSMSFRLLVILKVMYEAVRLLYWQVSIKNQLDNKFYFV